MCRVSLGRQTVLTGFAVVGLLVFGQHLAVPVTAQDLKGLKAFEADCVVEAVTFNTTCKGNLIGTATFAQTAFFVGSVGIDDGRPGDTCFLDAQNFVLTTPDGSTIAFETSGLQCNGISTYRRQHTYMITGGTGRFLGVSGGGAYNVAGLLPGAPATIHLDGNILFN